MKKTISALVLGAAAVGFATADLKIQAAYRNGAEMFKYQNTRESGIKADKTLFSLNSWNSGSDTVTLQASGNIFTFKTQFVPTVAPGSEDDISLKTMQISAKVGNFSFSTGWAKDGIIKYRANGEGRDTEGKQWETYKPGNTLGGLSKLSTNEIALTDSGTNYYAQAGYNFGLGDSLSLNTRVAVISNYSYGGDTYTKKYSPDGTSGVSSDLGWSVVLEPTLKDVFSVELLAKGQRKDASNYGFVFGGYASLLCLPVLPESSLGGAVGLWGGKVNDWSADLRLHFQLGDRIHLTTMNNFSMLMRNSGEKVTGAKKKNLGSATSLIGLPVSDYTNTNKKFASSQMLWDMVSLSFKLNDTFTIIGTVGQQTDFDSGEAKNGTQIFVNPSVEISAATKVRVTAGVAAGVGGLGANKDTGNKKADILITVPVLFRVQM